MTTLETELEALAKRWDDAGQIAGASACLRSLIAAEKARGPDPLLVQAREALREASTVINALSAGGWNTAALDAIAALDARLGGKT